MAFRDFMMQTVVILQVQDHGTFGDISSVTTIVTKGRLEPSRTLYRSQTQGVVASAGRLFLEADMNDVSAEDQAIEVAGVQFTITKKREMRDKTGVLRHLELEIDQ